MYEGVFPYERGGITWPQGARWRMDWDVVSLPRDAHASTVGGVFAYTAVADTQHPDACWEWIAYMSRRPPPLFIPARRSLAEGDAFEELVGAEAAAMARAAIEDAMILTSAQWAVLRSEDGGFFETLKAILNGDVDAESALTELQRRVDAR